MAAPEDDPYEDGRATGRPPGAPREEPPPGHAPPAGTEEETPRGRASLPAVDAGPAQAAEWVRRQAAETGRLLRAAEEARRRLAEAEEERLAAYASVEAEEERLNRLEERAAGIWKELTTRFGPHATGPLPEPADDPRRADPEELLAEAQRLAREPVDYALGGRYAYMAVLGFATAVAAAVLGLWIGHALTGLGRVGLLVAYGPALAGPWVGHLAAATWIRLRTSHEEREYVVDTAVAGTFGGGGVWLIGLALLIVRLVT